MHALEIDYERIREIMLKLADFLSDLGFDNVRAEIESASRLSKAVEQPRTPQDLAVINEYMQRLQEDIQVELRLNSTDQSVKRAKKIVEHAFVALSRCVRS